MWPAHADSDGATVGRFLLGKGRRTGHLAPQTGGGWNTNIANENERREKEAG
jgi:hypothetical protein